jgi:hypothetical protein
MRVRGLIRRLDGHENPRDRDEPANGGGDAERDRRVGNLEDGAAEESAHAEGGDGHDPVVAGDDAPTKVEELEIAHKLAPDSGQHDYGTDARLDPSNKLERSWTHVSPRIVNRPAWP